MRKIYKYGEFNFINEGLKKYLKNDNSKTISNNYKKVGNNFVYNDTIIFKILESSLTDFIVVDAYDSIIENVVGEEKYFDVDRYDLEDRLKNGKVVELFQENGLDEYLQAIYGKIKNNVSLDLDMKVIDYMANNDIVFEIRGERCIINLDNQYYYDISDPTFVKIMLNHLKCSSKFIDIYNECKVKLNDNTNISFIVDTDKLEKEGILPCRILKSEYYGSLSNDSIKPLQDIEDDYVKFIKYKIEYIPINDKYGFAIFADNNDDIYNMEASSETSFCFVNREEMLSKYPDFSALTLLKKDLQNLNYIEYEYKKIKTAITTFVNTMKKYSYNLYKAKDNNIIANQVYYKI